MVVRRFAVSNDLAGLPGQAEGVEKVGWPPARVIRRPSRSEVASRRVSGFSGLSRSAACEELIRRRAHGWLYPDLTSLA